MQTSKLLYYPDNADTHKLVTPGPFGEQPATYDGALVLWANDADGRVYPIQSSFMRMLLALRTAVECTGSVAVKGSVYTGATWSNMNYERSIETDINGSRRHAKVVKWRWVLQAPSHGFIIHPGLWYFEEPKLQDNDGAADFYVKSLALAPQMLTTTTQALLAWQLNYWALAVTFAELYGGSASIREGLDLGGSE